MADVEVMEKNRYPPHAVESAGIALQPGSTGSPIEIGVNGWLVHVAHVSLTGIGLNG